MHLAKRYYLGEDITLIRLFYRLNGKRQYLKINEIVTQCINKEINPADILFETLSITIDLEVNHGEYKYGYMGSWTVNPTTDQRLIGLNRLPTFKHINGLDHVLDITWEIIEYKLTKARAYEAIDLRYAILFLKEHQSVMYPLIRVMNKVLGRK